AARARARAATGVGSRARPPGRHHTLLRLVHTRHRRLRLRPASCPRRQHGSGPGLHSGVPAVNARRDRGALAIVLHTHMPYVEGFGSWPFGEEWLWEAMAGCYLPLLDLLDSGAPL